MKKIVSVFICIALVALCAVSLTACDDEPAPQGIDYSFLTQRFEPCAMSSFSEKYYELYEGGHGTKRWRQGMVTGNGTQGAVIAGSPYSDTIIFQNINFILPNQNPRVNPESAYQLEDVRQAIVNGKDIVDTQSYDDVYCYHPGATLRIVSDAKETSDYIRYTDYRSAVVGVRYSDSGGEWLRQTFTSFADDATITRISASDSGSVVDVTLSYDDLTDYPVNERDRDTSDDLSYGKEASGDGKLLYFVAHYQDYEGSELKDGGYATVSYLVVEGGSVDVLSTAAPDEEQYRASDDFAVEIEGAQNVYLITVSDRTYDLQGDVSDPSGTDLAIALASKAKAVADKYATSAGFDFDAALLAHAKIYSPQYQAVTFDIGGSDYEPNEELISVSITDLVTKDKIDSSLAQKTYYSGRYAQICCSVGSAPRLYGMWTGEWGASWGSKYTMDANVNLQVSALNTSNIASAPIGYANFILRQVDDWEDNARATHGYVDAIQAPVNSDGDMALMTESAYPYPFRYWNAGASWLLQPLYEALQCYGDIRVPLSPQFELDKLRSVLSPTQDDLTDSDIAEIKQRGYLDLRTEILYPLLIKTYNYWAQLLTPEYYTDADGYIHYEQGKTRLEQGESYCIIPSYSPENTPRNYPSPAAANSAVDIAACLSCIEMLKDVAKSVDASVDTSEWDALADSLPPFLTQDGALKEWACYDFEENNEHRHLSHLYCAWPVDLTKQDEELRQAALKAVEVRASENEASHALVHRALIGAKLEDAETVTDALAQLMNSMIYYDSLMTNHHTNRESGYCTDFAIGYVGIVNESLVYSAPGEVQLLPALPTKGFDEGKITGLRLRTDATLVSLEWSRTTGKVTAVIEADSPQTIVVSCGASGKTTELKMDGENAQTVTFELS